MLLQSPLWASAADKELLDARIQFDGATIDVDQYPGFYAPIYRNLSTFIRSVDLEKYSFLLTTSICTYLVKNLVTM